MKKVLFIGETWTKNITHIKGYDTFVTCHYEDCSGYLSNAMKKRGYAVTHVPAHEAGTVFPRDMQVLKEYSAIVLSDIGSNSFLLTNNVFLEGKSETNPLVLMKDFVQEGGGLLMVGGYMSFSGIEAKANYQNTIIQEILPITILSGDDRVEDPQGLVPHVTMPNHPILNGIEGQWPKFLGYNRLLSKEGFDSIVEAGESDVFIAGGEFGKGRTAVFASDCAPHWGTMDFVNWKYYDTLWGNLIDWITKTL